MQWLVGIDEAGRGALAGPVCVGAVLYPRNFDWRQVFACITKRGDPKLRDSKQLSAQRRSILYENIITSPRLLAASALVSAESIDTIGIVNSAHEAAAIAISTLGIEPDRVQVVLDAGLRVPHKWKQQSFVRGDETIPAIALASIVAKVTRDRHMEELAVSHAPYGFEGHKGYGTHAHLQAIRRFGPSLVHRRTFLSSVA